MAPSRSNASTLSRPDPRSSVSENDAQQRASRMPSEGAATRYAGKRSPQSLGLFCNTWRGSLTYLAAVERVRKHERFSRQRKKIQRFTDVRPINRSEGSASTRPILLIAPVRLRIRESKVG